MGAPALPSERNANRVLGRSVRIQRRGNQKGRLHRHGGVAPAPEGAEFADTFVRMGKMVDLMQRKRRLSQQQEGAGKGDDPGRLAPILSRRLCTH